LVLSDCVVPLENLLGAVGEGHRIAFNVLNVGRYKLGASAVGAARYVFRNGVGFAKQRIAFGKPITEFGLVQEKIADSAAGIYAAEAAVYRTVGAIDAALAGLDKSAQNLSLDVQKGIEEYVIECSILKVWCSEMLETVVDHMLQLHGGYGYVEEYSAERSYRDSRINTIFEGTNEINRLIITGHTLKRALAGRLALLPAIKKMMEEVMFWRMRRNSPCCLPGLPPRNTVPISPSNRRLWVRWLILLPRFTSWSPRCCERKR
jgi:butyryl-CoA dehydrogenase